jgi:hydrogenase maturation protease
LGGGHLFADPQIGIGGIYYARRDDGIGPALVTAVSELELPEVSAIVSDGEPSHLLETWSGARLAVIVDAARCQVPVPGRIHRSVIFPARPDGEGPANCAPAVAHRAPTGSASTHGLGIPDAVRLAEAAGRVPTRLVVFAVEVADIGFGAGLSAAVAGCLPGLSQAVLAERVAG